MHESVLLHETISALNISAEGVYVDGTFGRGGHSSEVLRKLSAKGRLLGFDKDPTAIAHAQENFANEHRLTMHHCSFSEMKQRINELGLLGQVDGILLDLGVSSPQLDESERGFSFLRDGPLDMRMDSSAGQTAAEWINTAEQHDIKHVLRVYGEENFAALIAKKVVERRETQPFERTVDLAEFIEAIIPKRVQQGQKKHAATRSFQAIRIFINRELEDLELLLGDVVSILKPGGRLVVISFHSLEDRIVKHYIREQERGPVIPRNIPIINIQRDAHMKRASKAIKASDVEVDENVRSRSAIMRAAEKVAGT